jgi:hypothetical protein
VSARRVDVVSSAAGGARSFVRFVPFRFVFTFSTRRKKTKRGPSLARVSSQKVFATEEKRGGVHIRSVQCSSVQFMRVKAD